MRISGRTHRHEETRCLHCGAKIDAATQIRNAGESEAKPEAGAITVCLHCGHIMAFADGKGRLRGLTDEEIVEIAGDPRLVGFNAIRGPALVAFEKGRK